MGEACLFWLLKSIMESHGIAKLAFDSSVDSLVNRDVLPTVLNR